MKKIIGNAFALLVVLHCFGLLAQPTTPGGGDCTNCPPPTNSFISQPYVPGLKLSIPAFDGTNLPINLW